MSKTKPQLVALPPLEEADDWRYARALALEVDHRQLERWLACNSITTELLAESGRATAAACSGMRPATSASSATTSPTRSGNSGRPPGEIGRAPAGVPRAHRRWRDRRCCGGRRTTPTSALACAEGRPPDALERTDARPPVHWFERLFGAPVDTRRPW